MLSPSHSRHSVPSPLRHALESAVRWILVLLTFALPATAGELGEIERPGEHVKRMFPEADRYEEHVRVIERTRSRSVRELLPEYVPYHEKGKRVVYSAHRGSSPLGFVHVRDEIGPWGVVRVAWQLNLDLTLRDFTLLRCRDVERTHVEGEAFRELLRGRDLRSLQDLLDDAGHVDVDARIVPRPAGALAETLVHSALKSLSVTQVGWSLDVSRSLVREFGLEHFPHIAEFEFEGRLWTAGTARKIADAGVRPIDSRTRSTLLIAHAQDAEGRHVASFAHARPVLEDSEVPVLIAIVDGAVVRAKSMSELPRPRVASRLARLDDLSFEELRASLCPLAQFAATTIAIVGTDEGGDDE